MTEWSGPFSSTTDGTEARWRSLHYPYAPDGVIYSGVNLGGAALAVSVAADALSVNVAAGQAVIQGALYESDATINLTNTANGGGSARPDRVVLRYLPALNTISLAVREGTVGNAAPTILWRESQGIWDIPLARWMRSAGGGITGLVDERQFVLPDGTVVTSDAAVTSAVTLSLLFPQAGPGSRVLLTPSMREFRYSGTFWERVDPAPLLDIVNVDHGTITGGDSTWRPELTGSAVLSGTFTAPASGRVMVGLAARIRAGSSNTQVWGTVRLTGPTNPALGPTGNDNAQSIGGVSSNADPDYMTRSLRYSLAGLTPGGVYTATFVHSANDTSAAFDQRRITIERA